MDANKGMSEDMTSLFLPDMSHLNTKRRVITQPESAQSSRVENKTDIDVTFPLNSQTNSQSNFANFLNNNDFITWKLPTDLNNQLSNYPSGTTTPGANLNLNPTTNFSDNMEAHGHNHYSNFVPYEAMSHHFHHHASSSLLFPSSNTQPQAFSKLVEGNWLGSTGAEMDRNLYDTKMSGQALNYAELMDQNSMLLQQLQQQMQLQNVNGPNPQIPSDFTPNSSLYGNEMELSNFEKLGSENPNEQKNPERKKRAYKIKPRNKSLLSQLSFDYKTENLTKLLDLKCRSLNLDYKLTDQKGNEININFQGFLNGRVLTNDFDNSTFVYGIIEQHGGDANLKNVSLEIDPKVISCYRRNFIQLFLNFNLEGFKNYGETDSKILKLQTSEYGYNISRVVKWFKIEISASSNGSNTEAVPIIITEDMKDVKESKDYKDYKDKMDLSHGQTDGHITPQVINTSEQIVSINKATVQNSKIENFYTVKKLQFKRATPNNGNLTIQNYYYLKIKLSAVVADLYFDDYIDEDFAATTDTSRNEIQLFELESEPITVRGRNPSFYSERKDILVKGRSPSSKKSYESSKKIDVGSRSYDDIMSKLNDKAQAEETRHDNTDEDKDDELDVEETNDPNNDNDNDYDDNSDDTAIKKSVSGLPVLPVNYTQKKSIPPVIYNANSVDLEGILGNLDSENDSKSNYKYFPITNVYYLPPVNVVYFPHSAHQGLSKIKNSSPLNGEDKNVTRRKSSNVYFK